MTIQKGNALLANRAGKSSALLLAPSVSQGSALHQVLSRLQGVKRSGTGYVALCPAHKEVTLPCAGGLPFCLLS